MCTWTLAPPIHPDHTRFPLPQSKIVVFENIFDKETDHDNDPFFSLDYEDQTNAQSQTPPYIMKIYLLWSTRVNNFTESLGLQSQTFRELPWLISQRPRIREYLSIR
jgi:hypothetical protein